MLKFFFFFLFSFFFSFFFEIWISLIFLCILGFFFFMFYLYSFGWVEFYGFFFLDSLSVLLVLLSLWVSFLMLLSSYGIFTASRRFFFFSVLVMVLLFFLIFCFSVSNILVFFFFFELSLIPTLLIILGWGYQPERLQAGLYMLMYTIMASLPLLVVILFLGYSYGSFFFFFPVFSSLESSFGLFFFFFFSLFAFFVKLPIFGFHLWLPKAHVEAPVSGSMILAGVLLKLGGYGIFRFFLILNFFDCFFSDFFMVFSLWGGVISSLVCLRQVDLKGLVAYSSVGHMGMAFSGLLLGSQVGVLGSFLMMVGHGLCSSCLFILASLGYDFFGSRSIFLVKGFLLFFPYLSFWWFTFISANMAAPFSINLFSELFLMMGLLEHYKLFFLFLSLLSFLCGIYSLYLFISSNHGFILEGSGSFMTMKFNIFISFFFHFFFLYFSFLVLDFFFMF